MSYLNSGLLSTYNSLTDKHLAGYFSNTRIRRHLRRAGLITRSGRIVSDKEYRLKLVRRDHQRHVRECLAQAIFHKVLNMEHQHQVEMKRTLEEFSRRERVHKLKMERSKRCDEDIIPLLSPKPPSGPRNGHKESPGPEEEHLESSESVSENMSVHPQEMEAPGSSRPNTAPGKMLRPHWLQPIHRNKTSVQTSPGCRHQDSLDNSEQLLTGMDKELRSVTMAEYSRGMSPYQLPLINFSTPVPPPTKRTLKGSPNAMVRGRRLRPTTAPNIPAVEKDSKFRKTSVHSNVSVTMVYYGKSVHLSHEDMDKRDEVKVFQQHCGGENLCVYKGKLMEEETFQFVSRRHQGFPFSLTFFLNGMQVDRLSSCCEFKHRVGSRLGGKHGHFGFIGVNGSSPCYKCIISMGLDKMPTPPKRTKEDMAKGSFPDNSQEIAKEAKEVEQDIEQDAQIHLQSEPRKEQNEDESMETQAKDIDEDKANDDYNDDFDADDERGDEDREETKPAVKDPSSSSDRRDSQVDKDDGGTVNHQRENEDKYSGSEFEEDVVAEDKKSPSCSYRSTPTRSREDSDSEAEEVSEAGRNEEGQLEKEEGQLPEELPETEIPACADEKDHHGQGEQKEEPDGHGSDTSSPTPPQTTAGATVGDTGAHETEAEGSGSAGLELSNDASITHPQEGQEVGKSDAELNGGDNEAKPEECSGDSEPERGEYPDAI
ncbi:hypothetical protein GJAV_G00069630 [Gymnothorax javanicus]|nr:hypothetical protein GJAV_G00069630 [Gymnothorax javanicus]